MKETDIQALFGKKNTLAGVFELKLVKGRSMPFRAVRSHQVHDLAKANGDEGKYHKLSDMSADKKPFDCFLIRNYPAYVVPIWCVPRKRKTAYYIPIGRFIELVTTSTRKSMTEEEAKIICKEIISL